MNTIRLGGFLFWCIGWYGDDVTAVGEDEHGASAEATCKNVHLEKPLDDFWRHAGEHRDIRTDDKVRALVFGIAIVDLFRVNGGEKV